MKRDATPRSDAALDAGSADRESGQEVRFVRRRPEPGLRATLLITIFVAMFLGILFAVFRAEPRTAVAVVVAPLVLLLLFGTAGEDREWRQSQAERRARQRRTRASRRKRS